MGAHVLVRPGLAIYGHCLPLETGVRASREGVVAAKLQPVPTWKTRVIGVREIAAGQTVGYGATFVADRAMRLALLPVGYADGFRREASSGVGDGWVMIAEQCAPVVGRVSMNLTVVDVTAIAVAREGDEVVLLGDGVSAEDHARWCGTIPYEILCGIRAHARLV
jgi:alanine racemase